MAISSGSILIDRTAPTPSWVATLIGESFDAVDFDLVFAESVSGLTLTDFLIVGSAANCNLTMHEVESSRSYLFHLTGCSLGSVQLASASAAFTDLLGNPGAALLSPIATLAAPVVVAAAPTPSPSPSVTATPSPSPSQTAVIAPVQPPAASAPQPETVIAPPVQAPPVQAPPAQSTQPFPTQPPAVVEPAPTALPADPTPAPTIVPAPEVSIEPAPSAQPEPVNEPEPAVGPLIESVPIPVLIDSEILVSRPLAIKALQVAKVASSEPTSVGPLELVPLAQYEPVQPVGANPAEPLPQEPEAAPFDSMPVIYLAAGGIAGTGLGMAIARAISARRARPSKRLQRLYA
jgi:hypothetical protein